MSTDNRVENHSRNDTKAFHAPNTNLEAITDWRSAHIASDGAVKNHGQPLPSHVSVGYTLSDNGDTIAAEGLYLGQQPLDNCEAECLAILAGLFAAKQHDYTVVYIYTDSKTVIDHLSQTERYTAERLVELINTIEQVLNSFEHYTIEHSSRTSPTIRTVHNLANQAFPDLT